MKQLFATFLESPDRESYLAVRAALVASQHYDPYSREMRKVNELLDAGQLDEARQTLMASMPNLLLSPEPHLAAACIAKELNDEQGKKMAALIAVRCCRGILATGDGTKGKPYIVARPSDEHDVLQYLGKQLSLQALSEEGKRHFDFIRCTDGSEMWFDITDAMNKFAERLGVDR